MVYSATENVKKRLGSCEKVTMKLRSLLNISNISSTCASHKRLEESSQVKDREFRLVTWDESSQVLMESIITSTTIFCINSIFHYEVDIKSNMCERCQYVVMGLTHIITNSKLYKLGGELGKGGFGVVYAAVRRADKLQVKKKILDGCLM